MTQQTDQTLILAGDIGGTKTNLAIYTLDAGVDSPLAEATFPSRRYDSLEELVKDFLGQSRLDCDWGVFGVAGPVVSGQAEVTNLPWRLDERTLEASLEIDRVKLLNDLESIANAIPSLSTADLHTIHPGRSKEGGAIAVVAPGTGLGEAFLTWDGTQYRAHPSEGGHVSFGPTDEEQVELLSFLLGEFGHVSYERVCSGLGIPNIYRFFRDGKGLPEPDWLTQEIAQTADPTPVIVNSALERGEDCPICVATLRTFLRILGAEAGNMALKVMASGGVYLGGGIPPRILDLLDGDDFREAYLDKGRFRDLLSTIPVHVIMNPKTALRGAAAFGLSLSQS